MEAWSTKLFATARRLLIGVLVLISTSPANAPSPAPPFTVEEAYRRCLEFTARAEAAFRMERNGALPDLRLQSDFDLLMQLGNPSLAAKETVLFSSRPQIMRYDFALNLFRSFVERISPLPPVLSSHPGEFWDALLGRLYYNVPPREYAFRAQRLACCSPQISNAEISPWLAKLCEAAHAVRHCECSCGGLESRMKDSFANPCARLMTVTRNIGDQIRRGPRTTFSKLLLEDLERSKQAAERFSSTHNLQYR